MGVRCALAAQAQDAGVICSSVRGAGDRRFMPSALRAHASSTAAHKHCGGIDRKYAIGTADLRFIFPPLHENHRAQNGKTLLASDFLT